MPSAKSTLAVLLLFAKSNRCSTADINFPVGALSRHRRGVGKLKPGKLDPAEPCSTRNNDAATSPPKISTRLGAPSLARQTIKSSLFLAIGLIRPCRDGGLTPKRSTESTICESSLSKDQYSLLNVQFATECWVYPPALWLIENHAQHRRQFVILVFTDTRFRPERPDIVWREFLPA